MENLAKEHITTVPDFKKWARSLDTAEELQQLSVGTIVTVTQFPVWRTFVLECLKKKVKPNKRTWVDMEGPDGGARRGKYTDVRSIKFLYSCAQATLLQLLTPCPSYLIKPAVMSRKLTDNEQAFKGRMKERVQELTTSTVVINGTNNIFQKMDRSWHLFWMSNLQVSCVTSSTMF
jgi:hypothetical protein